MSYFSFFPVTSVVLDGEKLEIKQVKNILVRAKFSNYLKEKEGLYSPYRIKENDRPDTLAHRFYGKSDLHWLILLFNEIIDPYFDWPLNDRALNNYIQQKYSGTAVYVEDLFYYASGNKKTQEISKTEPIINGNTQAQITTQTGVEPLLITSYDPTLSKMVVYGKVGSYGVPNSSFNKMIITNSNGIQIEAKIRYIEKNETAIHHFETTGEWLNPRGIPFEDIVESRIRIYTSGSERSLNLLGEINNTDYEIRLNEKKRVINLIKPEYVNLVLEQFSNLMKPRRKTQL
jgi:hypothetical protein